MRVIVGLGNPELRYHSTRHNAGFRVIDRLGIASGAHFSSKRDLLCDLAKVQIAGQEVLLVKPTTYMNLSGRSVTAVLLWFKLQRSELLVVHDDVSLPLGRIRLQKNGGAGGQHGVESIIECFGGGKEFNRLKFGVGPDPGGSERANYVLSSFPPEQLDLLERSLELSADAVVAYLREGILNAMNRFNGVQLDLPAVVEVPEPHKTPVTDEKV